MKASTAIALLTSFVSVSAHSGVWNLEVDGVIYPAFDTRMDRDIGAKRIEWSFNDAKGIPWGPVENVNDPGLTCGQNPKGPALKAVARAGSKATVQWSGVVRTHYGPSMNYMAYLPSPDTKPQDLSWFKISETGYDAKAKLWANEKLVVNNRKETMQIPSDLKPGTYVLRTELLSLHYATRTGPQFYTHCFNVEVNGNGTATPEGVKFPGAYTKTDPSLVFDLHVKGGGPSDWEHYKIPGPPKYAGKYDAPVGPAPVVSEKDRGVFPPEFQKKYDDLKQREDEEGLAFNQKLNDAQVETEHNLPSGQNLAKLFPYFGEHIQAQQAFKKEVLQLRQEALALGVAV